MKRILLATACAALISSSAFAQSNIVQYRGPVVNASGQTVNGPIDVTAATPLPVTSGSGASAGQVQGTAASGATASGNPVQTGCVYNASVPNLTNGQVVAIQCSSKGSQGIAGDAGGVLSGISTINALALDGTKTLTVGLGPTSTANAANAPSANAAVGSALIVKASTGNLYGWRVTSGASAGYVMIFDAVSAPADGAVTPKDCVVVAANSTVGSGPFDIPERYVTGITIVFSTTGCFSKTASATAFIRATFQ